jgi:hypothetical protein
VSRERGEEVGELVEKTGAERLDLNGRCVATREPERRVPVQALLTATADPDLT